LSIPETKLIVKWTEHKKAAAILAGRMLRISRNAGLQQEHFERRALSMGSCSSRIEVTHCPECGKLHVSRSWLCRDRLCPVCGWRLSIQRAGEMQQALTYMRDGGTPLLAALLTVTQKNVPPEALENEIGAMLTAWKAVTKRRAFARWVAGYGRSLEVTYNPNSKTFHPHIHVILFFKPGYKEKGYIPWAEWQEMWREAMGLDYPPDVDIRWAYDKATGKAAESWEQITAAAVETFKYSLKPGAALKTSDDGLYYLAMALKGRRLVSYAGSLRAARAALNIKDTDEPREMEETTLLCSECGCTELDVAALAWAVKPGAYVLHKPSEQAFL